MRQRWGGDSGAGRRQAKYVIVHVSKQKTAYLETYLAEKVLKREPEQVKVRSLAWPWLVDNYGEKIKRHMIDYVAMAAGGAGVRSGSWNVDRAYLKIT